ncbi:hypothetical protein AAFG07_18565 [Bradyrhizobium sp. B097]|uniref:hypothetical protein n=1 Tax=Bradyrhizobium sp. B097 TaxID=3140244 RepID=UPI0031844592
MTNYARVFLRCHDRGGRLGEGIARRADNTKQGHDEYTGQASGKYPLPDRQYNQAQLPTPARRLNAAAAIASALPIPRQDDHAHTRDPFAIAVVGKVPVPAPGVLLLPLADL